MSDDVFRSYDDERSRSLRSLREQTYRIAQRIGLEAAEATYCKLRQPKPAERPAHLQQYVDAWAEAITLLKLEVSLGEVAE